MNLLPSSHSLHLGHENFPFCPAPFTHLAGIVTIGAACAAPVSVSENMNIRKLNLCFDCLSRSSIQNHWLR
jgi:hypothetical protein